MEILSSQEKMHILQEKQTLLRKNHQKLMETLGDSSELGPMENSMVRNNIQIIRGEMMANRTGNKGLRALNKKLECSREVSIKLDYSQGNWTES